jgi:hypothetical protein
MFRTGQTNEDVWICAKFVWVLQVEQVLRGQSGRTRVSSGNPLLWTLQNSWQMMTNGCSSLQNMVLYIHIYIYIWIYIIIYIYVIYRFWPIPIFSCLPKEQCFEVAVEVGLMPLDQPAIAHRNWSANWCQSPGKKLTSHDLTKRWQLGLVPESDAEKNNSIIVHWFIIFLSWYPIKKA